MIRRLLNLALTIALAPFIYWFSYQGYKLLVSVFTLDSTKWFLGGAALSLVVYALLLNNNIDFVEHLFHELEHAAVAFIFTFQWPRRMEVDPEQGSKVVVPPRGGCITTLGPSFFPLLTVPLLLLKTLLALALPLLKVPFPTFLAVVFDLLIGATLMFHLLCSLKEFGSFQSDVKKTGLIPSVVGVLFLNLMFLVLSVVVVTDSYAELVDSAKTAVAAMVDAYKVAWEYLRTDLLPTLGDLIEAIKDWF
jgi:hypothetical protein